MAFYTPETFDVEELLRKAKQAQKEFAKLDQEAVDKIFLKVAHEADKNRVPLAIMAVEETKMGLVEDKVLKNGLAAEVRDRKCSKHKLNNPYGDFFTVTVKETTPWSMDDFTNLFKGGTNIFFTPKIKLF